MGHVQDLLLDFTNMLSHWMGHVHGIRPLAGTFPGPNFRFYYGVESFNGICSGPISRFSMV